eukprot:383618_1
MGCCFPTREEHKTPNTHKPLLKKSRTINYKGKFVEKYIPRGNITITDSTTLCIDGWAGKDGNASARLDAALPKSGSRKDIITWCVRFGRNDPMWTDDMGFACCHYFVGVVSQNCKDFNMSALGGGAYGNGANLEDFKDRCGSGNGTPGLKDAFGVIDATGLVVKGTGIEIDKNMKDLGIGSMFKFDKDFQLKYDCSQSRLSFFYDNVFFCEMALPENNIWYPAVSWSGSCGKVIIHHK